MLNFDESINLINKENKMQLQIFLMKVNCVCGGKLFASNKRKSFLFIEQNQINSCEWNIFKERITQTKFNLGDFK